MEIFCHLPTWTEQRRADRRLGKTLGFVPTMGALHEGHLSLVRRSLEENDQTLVSLFVNPTQFDNPSDLENYPNLIEADLELLKAEKIPYVLLPDYEMIYPDGFRYKVTETEESRVLCGAHRPGHFDGVLSVVLKLLNLAQAERAYFGEKDYQQFQLVKRMAEAFFLDVQIIGCPLVREADGLAMSSRNLRLTQEQRRLAPAFYKILSTPAPLETVRRELAKAGFAVEYVEEKWGRRLAAVNLGKIRLIDNVPVTE